MCIFGPDINAMRLAHYAGSYQPATDERPPSTTVRCATDNRFEQLEDGTYRQRCGGGFRVLRKRIGRGDS